MGFEVLPAELESARSSFQLLAGRLAELAELGRSLEGAVPMAGPTVLVHAMGAVNSGWMRVAEQVATDLEGLARRLASAAGTYEVTDRAAVGG